MITTNFARYYLIDKQTQKEILAPRGFILDYADDELKIYCYRKNGSYKVINKDFVIKYRD